MPGVYLKEWQRIDFEKCAPLAGLELSPAGAALAAQLTSADRIRIEELRRGVRIETTSFVGRVTVDDLVVTVEPKIARRDLLRLFAYAYDLDVLTVYDETTYDTGEGLFVDLIIRQLIHEVRGLCERGLHRAYVRVAEDLASPRGAIDMGRLVGYLASGRTSVPSIHHPRDIDHLLNGVLRGGLELAARIATTSRVRLAARRAAEALEGVASPRLSAALMSRAVRALDRRVLHYAPALTLVEILWAGTSLDLDERVVVSAPGFLFDMNRFWQALLGRLLRDNLDGVDVIADRSVRRALRYADGFDHPGFRTPTARPDFVLVRGGKRVAVLDAKYRDLWTRELPSSMLYQLATYASVQGPGGTATILYPTDALDARDVRIDICAPGADVAVRASVVVRPVHVDRLLKVIATPIVDHERQSWVRFLAGVPDVA